VRASDGEDGGATKPSDEDALVDELQRSLPLEGEQPAWKRSAESQALPFWRERSTRREDLQFEHSRQHADLRRLDDQELGEKWGWVSKHRGRGLSSRDRAIQREVYARSLSVLDLYGLDWSPRASSWSIEALRGMGCRSTIARDVVALLELMIARGRMALRLSAPEARTLLGYSHSGWWLAIARLEDLGILKRIGTVKPNEDGPAPVQTSKNMYVLGPWWFEPLKGVTPLASALGLAGAREGKSSRAAQVTHHHVMHNRKERSRAHRTYVRDRNRRRHHGLEPRVTSTVAVLVEVERLATQRAAELETQRELRDRVRGQALMQGRGVTLGEPHVSDSQVDVPSSLNAEAAAVAQVDSENRGGIAREGLKRAVGGLCESKLELPSTKWSAIPKGKTEGNLILSQEPPTANKHPSPREKPDLGTKSGDKSGSRRASLGDRARALDGEARDRMPSSSNAVQLAYEGLFGNERDREASTRDA